MKREIAMDNGVLTLLDVPFQGTSPVFTSEIASIDHNSADTFCRFPSWAHPVSLAVTRGILVSFFSSAY